MYVICAYLELRELRPLRRDLKGTWVPL